MLKSLCVYIFYASQQLLRSGERSFSTLKRVKNGIRTRMSEDRLNALALLSIESDLLRSLDFADIITEFASLKARRMPKII